MNDTYQAIYDAIRSRISGGNFDQAVTEAIQNLGLGDQIQRVTNDIQQVVANYLDPSVLYRPKLYIDGGDWCALYGDDLQSGVCGFGLTPDAAMLDFNKNWYSPLNKK